MVSSIATYISLPGTTGEALTHWHEVLGGELNILRYGDMPPMEGMPFTPDPQAVAHGTLVLPNGAGEIAGGDSLDSSDTYPVTGTAYSLLINASTVSEGRDIIEKFLASDGQLGMPFDRAPWGSWYGQVFDRYGVMWAISCDQTDVE